MKIGEVLTTVSVSLSYRMLTGSNERVQVNRFQVGITKHLYDVGVCDYSAIRLVERHIEVYD